MRRTLYKSAQLLLMAAILGSTAPPGLYAQDAVVVPANDNTKIPWVSGGALGTVTAATTVTGWSDLGNVTDANTANYAYIGYSSGILGGTYVTPEVSISNGQTYNTTPFTGYRIGVIATRTKSALAVWNNTTATDEIRIRTYKNGILAESVELDWGGGGNTINADVGFYVHKEFDEVRVQLVSSVLGISNGQQRLAHVYFQRYTRQGGSTGFQATCNAQIPLTGRGLTAQGLSMGLGIPPYLVPALPNMLEAMEDGDPSTHAVFPMITTFFALGTRYEGSVKDEAVVYPAGTYAGFKLTLGAGFGTNAADIRTLNLLRNGVVVASSTNTGLIGAALLSSDGSTTIGMLAPVEFDEIQYSITTLLSPTPGLNIVEVHYPVIQRFCDAPVACAPVPEPVNLIRGYQNGATNYPVYAQAVVPLSIGTLNATIKDIDNVIDDNLTNYAEISQVAGGVTEYGISVVSRESGNYPAGTFAGFRVEDISLFSANFGIRHLIRTYKDGMPTGDEYDDGGSAVSAKFLANTGQYLVGMKTTQEFDEVRLSIQSIGSVGAYTTRVYNAVIEPFCKSTLSPDCNELTLLNRSSYPVYIDGNQTGTGGNSIGTLNHYFQNLNNIIDDDPGNYASLITNAGISSSASVAIQDGSKGIPGIEYELYPAGTYVGFDVSFPTVASASFLSDVTISLLGPDGSVVGLPQTISGNIVGLHSSLASGNISRQVIGVVADVPFSGIKFTASKGPNVAWGEVRIYNVVLQKFCQGPVISCDNIDTLSTPSHPLYINGKRTGIFAGFDGNAGINNSQYAIDGSANTYAELQVGGATALSTLGFSVANGYSDYPAKTYVGFDLSTQSWFEGAVLSQTKIELYKDDLLVSTSTGDQLGAGVTSDLVTGGWKRYIIGTVAQQEFDEVRLVISRAAGASVGEIRIHNFVARNFDSATAAACAVTLDCNTSYPLTDNDGTGTEPTIPAVVEFDRTGYQGVITGGYGLDNPWNVVSPSKTDYATIHLPAAGGTMGSISVATPGVVFPSGTFAGFTVDKQNFIVSGGLFTGVTVTTYLHGQQQEQKTNGALADFTLLTQWFGTPANFYTPGFETTLPFDEVRLSIGGIVSGADQTLHVYGAYADLRAATPQPGDGSTPMICGPDLTPSTTMTNPTFTIADSTNGKFIINISEIIGKSTQNAVDPVYVRVTRSPNFTYTFNPSATMVGGTAVNNTHWTLTSNTSTSMTFQLNPGIDIAAYGLSRIGLMLQVNPDATAGYVNITVTIINNSGGDINNNNNTSVRQLSVQ